MSEDEMVERQPTGWNAPGRSVASPVSIPASFIDIRFQEGPVQEAGVNGCQVEDVIDVLVARLQEFQRGPFQCGENEAAIQDLLAAKQRLLVRTARRQKQGVEGTNQPHVSAD